LNYPEEDHASRESDNSATSYIHLANAAYFLFLSLSPLSDLLS